MKQFAVPISLPRLLLALAFVGSCGVLGYRWLDVSYAAGYNTPPTISISLSCNGSTGIATATWRDPNGTTTGHLQYTYGGTTTTSPAGPTGAAMAVAAGYASAGNWTVTAQVQDVNIFNTVGSDNPVIVSQSASHAACTVPVTIPVTTPTPIPVPIAPPAPITKSSGTTKPTSGTGTKTSTVAAVPAPSAAADATVTAGTTVATITVPVDGAAGLYVTYAAAGSPSANTDNQAVSSGDALVTLQNLQAMTMYSYQIVRTNSAGVAATSAAASFTTSGYGITLHLADAHSKPVSGISGRVDDAADSTATSDKNGNMSFTDLPSGTYTVHYTYKNQAYAANFDTSTAPAVTTPDPIVLTDAVNVDKLAHAAAPAAPKRHTTWPLFVLGLFLVAIAAASVRLFLARRSNRPPTGYDPLAAAPAPLASPVATAQPVVATHPKHTHSKPQAVEAVPAHAGESLRDMVLESMHEQALRQAAQTAAAAAPVPAQPATPITVAATATPVPRPALPPAATKPSQAPAPKPSEATLPSSQPAAPLTDLDGQSIKINHDS